MADLEISTTDRVMVARLNRQEKKNALSEEMLDDLREALRSANENPDIGCFVITGAGDSFCSGGDLGRRAKESAAQDNRQDNLLRARLRDGGGHTFHHVHGHGVRLVRSVQRQP